MMTRIRTDPSPSTRDLAWEAAGEGIRRKMLTYDTGVMMVRVAFEPAPSVPRIRTPHVQCSLVEQGVFDITIAGRTERLQQGDSFLVAAERHARRRSRRSRRASRRVHAHAGGFRRPQALAKPSR